jgi:hypothetical protein
MGMQNWIRIIKMPYFMIRPRMENLTGKAVPGYRLQAQLFDKNNKDRY